MKNGGSRRGEIWRRKKSWRKKISSPRCPVSLSPSSTSTTNQGLKGQDVFEPLFLVVIAAQCRDHSQCWPLALSLELDRCHERFHLPTRHKLTEYVMNPIHRTDLFVFLIYDMETHSFVRDHRLMRCDSLPSGPTTPFTQSPEVPRGPEGSRREPSP